MRYYKFLFLLLVGVLTFVVCHKPVENDENAIFYEFSKSIGTRSTDAIENTVWEYVSGSEYNQYIWFKDNKANLFYGLVEGNELQRWSDFFTSDYKIEDGMVKTDISYPEWGKTEKTENATLLKIEDSYSLSMNGKMFNYVTYDISGIDGYWMTITVTVAPWL